ncbi:hypothetical protein B0H13DRAFT_1857527 [Mycena leptocephala]|nr:hypothetical protein B0H13DRAFT_1857527 [Mycena leptocephala]
MARVYYLLDGLLSSYIASRSLIPPSEVAPSLDLSQFPALTCLDLTEDDRDSTNLRELISTLKPNNRVQKLAHCAYPSSIKPKCLEELGAFIADYTLPGLKEVEVQVLPHHIDGELDCAPIRASLPQLARRGMLSVGMYWGSCTSRQGLFPAVSSYTGTDWAD